MSNSNLFDALTSAYMSIAYDGSEYALIIPEPYKGTLKHVSNFEFEMADDMFPKKVRKHREDSYMIYCSTTEGVMRGLEVIERRYNENCMANPILFSERLSYDDSET